MATGLKVATSPKVANPKILLAPLAPMLTATAQVGNVCTPSKAPLTLGTASTAHTLGFTCQECRRCLHMNSTDLPANK